MKPTPLDEYPIHQTPLPMARVASSDRNFYDRCYFNAHNGTDDFMLIAGAGIYPNLGVQDAFLLARSGDQQYAVRKSDALDTRPMSHQVGSFRVEVIEPLRQLRLINDSPDDVVQCDLVWTQSFPAVLEQPHQLIHRNRPTLDAQRFAQVGAWSGIVVLDGAERTLDPSTATGSRDRSWGVRPSGDAEPPGRNGDEPPADGFWWLYVPFRFETFAVIVIVQEDPDGFRTLNDATRVFADGRVEQLGWPRIEIDYRPGTRHPERCRLHLTTPKGEALVMEIETITGIALHIGGGYGGDSEWSHGQWQGRDFTKSTTYDLTDPDTASKTPWGVSDHVAVATCAGERGVGLFEHASLGRHDPTGFADYFSVAP
ncbi:MAG: hypothetical protein KDB38_11665 [Nocardioidaceae bacterium]|nr:hypothetical protein [Nocardioidaceae bacterium]MCO5325069.1 hypothetical protein [Nocardioidaceae bacterium]